MRRSRSAFAVMLACSLVLGVDTRLEASGFRSSGGPLPATVAGPNSSSYREPSTPAVIVRAASGATVGYVMHNGETVDGVSPQAREIPHLVLHRNGALTVPDERMLILEVTDIAVPAGGVTITLAVTTEHVDPDFGTGSAAPIPVWQAAIRVTNTRPTTMTVARLTFTHTFSETVAVDAHETPTPTDYFGYTITIASTQGDGAAALRELKGNYAFLMENQVVAPLPEAREQSEGAAPDELVVYYYDLLPFRWRTTDGAGRVPRGDIPSFVHNELVPAMVEAYRIQTEVWGFGWHDAWTSYCPEAGQGQLPVVLTDGETWYHGMAPAGGHAGISLNTNGADDRAPYDTLTDDLLSTFHHELFHNLQRSINQGQGGDGRVGGADDAWVFFSEGTAFLASSVGRPSAHFGPSISRGHVDSETDVYRAPASSRSGGMLATLPVMYWRYLYEQCGGMKSGFEDPAAGMAVVRHALTTLYSGDVVDIAQSRDLYASLARVIDNAIANTSSCPFRTYEQSLVHFAYALYALGLEGSRCVAPGIPAGCGFYDPHSLYRAPSVTAMVHRGGQEEFRAYSWSSLDVDLFEVTLQPGTAGRPLELVLEPKARGDAGFIMQVWKLVDEGSNSGQRPVSEQAGGPEVVGTAGPGERITYDIATANVTKPNRLAVIITRVPAEGSTELCAEYTIRLGPRASSSSG